MSTASPGGVAYDLVVVGGNAGGLSVAVSAQRSGLRRVRILEETGRVGFSELVGEHQLDVGYGEVVESIDHLESNVVVTTDKRAYTARACVVAQRSKVTGWTPPVKTALGPRILVDQLPEAPAGQDVMVVGATDHAVEITATLATAGAGVVLAAGDMNPVKLSPAGEAMLRRLEKERRVTILYRSMPDQVSESDGFPWALFTDRRTPDLEFDYVVFASPRLTMQPKDVGLTDAAATSGTVWFLGEADETDPIVTIAPAWRIEHDLAGLFPELEAVLPPSPAERGRGFASVVDELREEHYNAAITYFEPTHSDLWVVRVRPDRGEISHSPGQYASLGLGYWEERIDDAQDSRLDRRWDKMIRRSYSISHRIFDEHGYLSSDRDATELEFYIVLVPPTADNVPGLTPRLALKRPGDRIYLGPKVAGRYTLTPVTDPLGAVLLFATGTGEAPHNAMVVELLRKGHRGPIVSVVSVRRWADLAYLDKHRELESRYANYHYVPMPTREHDFPKRYVQDLITNDVFSDRFGVHLDAERTHVFLCGNPAMIGLPQESEDQLRYPEPTGAVELLAQRGFTLDQRKQRGNIHFEEYW